MFQIDSTSKEGGWGDGHSVRRVVSVGGDDEGAEKRKWSRTHFGVRDDILPVIVREFKMPDLSKMRREEGDSAGGRNMTGDHVQGGSFCALEEGFHVDLTFSEE